MKDPPVDWRSSLRAEGTLHEHGPNITGMARAAARQWGVRFGRPAKLAADQVVRPSPAKAGS
jgi:hypothetical protein